MLAAPEIDDAHATRRRVRQGVGILIGSSVLFGVMAVCVRVAARELPALQIAWVRFAGSFVLLYGLARGRRLRPRPGNLVRVLLRGVLGGSAIVCYFVAIGRIGAGLATLLQCTYPIPTALFAVALLGEPASRRLAAAIVVNVVGIVLVLGPGAHAPAAVDATASLSNATAASSNATAASTAARAAGLDGGGVAIALVGAMLAGAAVATARHLRASEDASLITVYFMAVGAVMTAPALVGGVAVPSAIGVAALAGVVVTSAAGQWLLHHGLGFTPASLGSLACATSVVTAAGLEALVLGTHLGATVLVGAGFMVAAVGLAASRAA